VIRTAAQDRHRPVDLLGQQDAGQGVGPGLGSESQHLVGAGAQCRVLAVGGADQEHEFTLAAIAQLADVLGEGAAAPGLAALVAGDDAGVLEVGFELGPGLIDLDDLDRPQAQRPPGGGGAGGIVEGELSLGRRRELAVDQQGYLQARSSAETSAGPAKARGGGSTDQIFSML
jgi:hypothetical protein